MTKVRDRTEDFKDAARRAALNLGYNESKTAAIMASFIMHKSWERSAFTKAAFTTLESIGALEQFLQKHKKDYVDHHRTTEQERDSIEHEVTVFIKACKEQIDVLKNSINDEEANSKDGLLFQLYTGSDRILEKWLSTVCGATPADSVIIFCNLRKSVLILSEKLHSVTSQFDQLRALRFQDAINRVTPRRKLKRDVATDVVDSSPSGNVEPREVKDLEVRQTDDIQAEPVRFQQQLLDDETRALQVELASMLDAVQETETKMVEMSALNHLMSTHVLQQAQQIEYLYEQFSFLIGIINWEVELYIFHSIYWDISAHEPIFPKKEKNLEASAYFAGALIPCNAAKLPFLEDLVLFLIAFDIFHSFRFLHSNDKLCDTIVHDCAIICKLHHRNDGLWLLNTISLENYVLAEVMPSLPFII
ncbi:UNVERIFIED_CONTAM: syntaxin [Sesamum angustifolium]|uniref:Syntaxin n=1 Tax=Sesamum angustifolium TaxID=2727405 RepID=A0AAW2PUQ1_9LAMI